MTRGTKLGIWFCSAAALVGLATVISRMRAADDLLAPVTSHIYRERTECVQNPPFPVTAFRIAHLRGVELPEVVRLLRPELIKQGYFRSKSFGDIVSGVTYDKRMGGNYSEEVEILDGSTQGLDGVIVCDIRDASPFQSVLMRISRWRHRPPQDAFADGGGIRRFLGE